ncbi:hypothetical protein ES288_A11G245800v1 [Gossypium darwinii]|uniref:Mitochondrial outer membrane protein porin 2-like n=1 Tax=Gossypium darwinii TaxID=34276 RepID=A0A5D2ENC0_GOSDA|nr:hypothetical protein ES288_A11G245800v1 [Gossypium darwinii]
MSKGPGLFVDIGKRAKDLLTKDYTSDQKFTVSTYTGAGVAITSTSLKKGGLSTGDVAALYKYKNTQFDVKTIASFKVPDYNSGKLEVQYFHHHATFTTTIALYKTPVVDATATIGTPSIAFGAEAGYDPTKGNFTKYTAGISVTKPDSCASIILGDKGDSIKASYVHYLDNLKKSAAVGEISRKFSTNENTFTVGGAYAVDHLTLIKAKLNNHGRLGALLQHEVIPKSLLTVSGELDTKSLNKSPRLGLAFALKP